MPLSLDRPVRARTLRAERTCGIRSRGPGAFGLAAGFLLHSVVAPVGCHSRSDGPGVEVAIQHWLRCTECDEGQLETLVLFRDTAIPGLEDALLAGPPQGDLDRFRQSLHEDYDRLVDRAASLRMVPELSRQDYVDIHESNLIAREQIRAATALHAIGGNEAITVLEAAANTNLRSDVLALIRSLLNDW